MPRFKITDHQTGKTVTISGDSEPTQMDVERIFKEAGLRDLNVEGEKLQGLMPYKNIPETGDFKTDVARGIIRDQYRNIDKPSNALTRGIRSISEAAPAAMSTIAGAITAPMGRRISSGASGAGYGTGQAFGESLENMAGIQDETPDQLAREATIDPVVVGSTDYAIDLGFDAAGKLVRKPLSAVRDATGKVGQAFKKMVDEDFVGQFDPTKGIRRNMREHGINIAEALKRGGFGDDAAENLTKTQSHKKTVANSINSMLSRNPKQNVDIKRIAKGIADSEKKKARSTAARSSIDGWLERIMQDYPDGGSLVDAFNEKAMAGASAYKKIGTDAKDAPIAQAERQLERQLRESIIDSLGEQDAQSFNTLMRIYEENEALGALFENALDSDKPLTIGKRIQRLLSPFTIGQETVGRVAESTTRFGRRNLPDASSIVNKVSDSMPSVDTGMMGSMLSQGIQGAAAGLTPSLYDGSGGGIDPMGPQEVEQGKNRVFYKLAEKMESMADFDTPVDTDSVAKVAGFLQKAGVQSLDSDKATDLIKKALVVLKYKEKSDQEKIQKLKTQTGLLEAASMSESMGVDPTMVGMNQGVEMGAFSPEGVPLYK